MAFTKFKGYFPSADDTHDIAYYVYFPVGKIKAVLQISHGMCEYFERYSHFAEFLANEGFCVCGNDHLGHGDSVNNDGELGWFSEQEGWENAVNDMYTLMKIMKNSYADLPYFLFGHSMGSFLARAFVTKCGKFLDGAIFCGTGGGMAGVPELLTFVDLMKKIHGDKYRSQVVNKLAFGAYNAKILNKKSDFDWISRDDKIVDKYKNDKKCNYIFTLNGFENLAKVMWYVSNNKWYQSYPRELPTYLIGGSGDPVGEYGRGVLKVYNKLSENECNVEMKIYKDARHELLNESNKDEVFADILSFLNDTMCTDYCTDSEE